MLFYRIISNFIFYIPCIICLVNLVIQGTDGREKKAGRKAFFLILFFVLASIDAILTTIPQDTLHAQILYIFQQVLAVLLIPSAILLTEKYRVYGPHERIGFYGWIPVAIMLAAIQILLVIFSDTGDIIPRFMELTLADRFSKVKMSTVTGLSFLINNVVIYGMIALQLIYFIILSILQGKRNGSTGTLRKNITLPLILATGLYTARLFFQNGQLSGIYMAIGAAVSLLLSAALLIMTRLMVLEAFELPSGDKLSVPDECPETYEEIVVPEEKEPDDFAETVIERRLPFASIPAAYDEDPLRNRFEELMKNELLFLRQGLKVTDVASMLKTNRTYISKLVNNTYHMSFSDFINTLRIDYAEQYLLHNRGAKQDEIAKSCGFPNASSFNSVFRKITGVTPKTWYKEHKNNVSKQSKTTKK